MSSSVSVTYGQGSRHARLKKTKIAGSIRPIQTVTAASASSVKRVGTRRKKAGLSHGQTLIQKLRKTAKKFSTEPQSHGALWSEHFEFRW